MSPRKLAKGCLMEVRRARIAALAAPRAFPWLRRRLHLPANAVFDPLAPEPSAQARTIRLDPGETFRRPLPFLSGTDEAALPFFAEHATDITPPSFVTEFTGGVAWGHPTGGVFAADGRFAPAFTHDPCGAKFHSVWTRLHLPRPASLKGRVLYLVTPEATDNFHHWLIDLMPRLGLVTRAGYALQDFDHVVVNHSQRRYQLATLAHVGIPAHKLIAADGSLLVRADVLVVPSLKASNQTVSSADLAYLRGAFLGTDTAAPRRRIFLSREDAGYRRLLRERDFHALLRSYDFEIVTPAGLDVVAQAKLFSEAEIVAGPAGAAFANLAFAHPSARVLEIAPPQWLAAFHWMVSARLGLEHHVVLGDGPVMRGVPDSSARHQDLSIGQEKLGLALERVAGGVRA